MRPSAKTGSKIRFELLQLSVHCRVKATTLGIFPGNIPILTFNV